MGAGMGISQHNPNQQPIAGTSAHDGGVRKTYVDATNVESVRQQSANLVPALQCILAPAVLGKALDFRQHGSLTETATLIESAGPDFRSTLRTLQHDLNGAIQAGNTVCESGDYSLFATTINSRASIVIRVKDRVADGERESKRLKYGTPVNDSQKKSCNLIGINFQGLHRNFDQALLAIDPQQGRDCAPGQNMSFLSQTSELNKELKGFDSSEIHKKIVGVDDSVSNRNVSGNPESDAVNPNEESSDSGNVDSSEHDNWENPDFEKRLNTP